MANILFSEMFPVLLETDDYLPKSKEKCEKIDLENALKVIEESVELVDIAAYTY